MSETLVDGKGTGYRASIGSDGSIRTTTPVDIYTQRLDYDGGYQPVYVGLAEPGANTGSAVWQVKKNTISNGIITEIKFASGTALFDKIWDDRESGPYS